MLNARFPSDKILCIEIMYPTRQKKKSYHNKQHVNNNNNNNNDNIIGTYI